ncbi:YybH family protein [Massilia sp. GCM10023247]|uniref:YybH family protein n=1 Tax=Massilia sp. GCM10023247 TaxID=3252643 RepID=UPI003605D678
MFNKCIAAAALAASSFAVHSASLAATPTDTVNAFHAALARGDQAGALAFLSPQVAIYEAGHVERSRDEYAGHHLGGDIAFAKSSTRKVLKQAERIEGNMALVMEETETTGSANGKPVHAFGTGTTVLEKKGDDWSIVHVHWSSRKAK